MSIAKLVFMQKRKRPWPFTLFIFLGLCLSPFLASAKDIGFRCRAVYANPSSTPQTVYSGVLVELRDGKQSLVYVPNAWGPGHETALRNIIMNYDETNPVTKVLWMGELSLRERASVKPKLVAVNDISGTYFKSLTAQSMDEIPYFNDVKAIQDFVSKNGLWDVAQTKYVPFKENQSHLDWTSEYLKRELQLSNTAHDIGSVFSRVISSGEIMEVDKNNFDKFKPLLRNELRKYRSMLEVLAHENVFDRELIHQILELSGTVMNGDITASQLKEFNLLNRQLLDSWRKYSNFLESKIKII